MRNVAELAVFDMI